jgi:hypothetical protein
MATITTIIITIARRSLGFLRRIGSQNGPRQSGRTLAPVHLLIPRRRLSIGIERARATIRPMKRIAAAILLCTFFAVPAFAAKHPHLHHKKISMKYKAPKSYKVHSHKQKQKHHHSA